jgi:hypothetical protein
MSGAIILPSLIYLHVVERGRFAIQISAHLLFIHLFHGYTYSVYTLYLTSKVNQIRNTGVKYRILSVASPAFCMVAHTLFTSYAIDLYSGATDCVVKPQYTV